MTDDDLLALARTIRIGAAKAEIDRLAAHSDGMLTAASLMPQGTKWPHPQKQPCVLRFDPDDRVAFLRFESGTIDVPGLDPAADLDAVRRSFPDHGERYRGSLTANGQHVSLRLGKTDDGAIIVCDFKMGRQTWVSFWSPDALAEDERKIRALEAQMAQEDAEKARKRAKAEEERAAHAAWRRTAHPDDVLRQWARSHSAWGEGSGGWTRLVDWLISDSTAIDRHLVMRAYNWDHGVEIPTWIIRQPDTQLATVLTIFWLAEPSFFVNQVARNEAIPAPYEAQYEMLLLIRQNVASGFYKTPWPWQRIAFAPLTRATWDASKPEVRRAADLLVPDGATAPIRGRTVSDLATVRALPFDPGILS